jgi:RecA-family ATPase
MFRKRTVFIVAAGGTGKTLWNRRLTYHLSRGEHFGGFAPNRDDSKRGQARLRVVNFLGEDDDESLRESIWYMTEGSPAGDWFNFPMAGNKLTLMENDGRGNLCHSTEFRVIERILFDIVEKSGPLDMVTFDTLARFFGLPGASFDSEVAQTWMTQVAEKVANKFNCVVVVYAHTQKGTKEIHADMLRGASGWRDAARLVCGMVPLSENDALLADIENEGDRRCYIKLGIVKTNNTKSTFPFQYYRIFSTKGDTGDIEPAQLLQENALLVPYQGQGGLNRRTGKRNDRKRQGD